MSRIPIARPNILAPPPTQFDSYINGAKIDCYSLNPDDENESLLLQSCQCEYGFCGDDNYCPLVGQEKYINYDYTFTQNPYRIGRGYKGKLYPHPECQDSARLVKAN